MSGLEWLEAASYIVTIVGLPLAISVFVYDRRRHQQTDEEEVFLQLVRRYADFMRLVIDDADLHLLSPVSKASSARTSGSARRPVRHPGQPVRARLRAGVRGRHWVGSNRHSLWQSWADYMHE